MQIGTFKSSGLGYNGKIETLTLKAALTLEPNRSGGANAPAFRVFAGVQEIGIAFKKTSEKGNAYLSVLIDDPSFAKPIWANLLTSSKSDELPLMWDRPKPKKEA